MVAFATAEDLATAMQRDFSAEETATATQALDIASDIIRTYTGQQIDEVAADSVSLVPLRGNGGVLILAETPVTEVASVTENAVLLVEDTDYAWSPAGILWRIGVSSWVNPVVVVYTHGRPTIPNDIKGVTLNLAAGLFGSAGSGDIKSESIGMYQVTYGDSAGGGLGIIERAVLDRYKA